MNPSDPSERIERLKQVLADSYPQRPGEGAREPLPESIRAALGGRTASTARPAARKEPMIERLLGLFRAPQWVAIGATAVLVIAAVITFGPSGPTPPTTGGPQDMRSPGGDSVASIVVLRGLDADRVAALKDSGYFRDEQLLVVPAGEDLAAFLEARRRPNLVLVDGERGEMTTPFAGEGGPAAIAFSPEDRELADPILEMLAALPEPEPAGKDGE